jgi:GTP pyrophosphokinase
MKLIEKAKKIRQIFNSDKRRLNGESMIEHTDKIVKSLLEQQLEDEKLIALAYLDHIDINVSSSQIILDELGPETYENWLLYNKLAGYKTSQIELNKQNRDNILQTILNLAKKPEVLILRLVNKVENIKSTKVHDKEFAKKVSMSALNIYAPIAKITGFNKFAYILENEGFKVIDPESYYKIENFINESRDLLEMNLSDITEFTENLAKEHNIPAIVEGRIKSPYSIHKKMLNKNISSPEEIYDTLAIRVIVEETQDCYKMESLLNEVFTRIDNQRDDYIIKPKSSGYKSLHNVYKIDDKLELEVQLKTKEMHKNNEFGISSHFLYKHEQFKEVIRNDSNLLIDLNYYEGNYVDMNKFSKHIYVFTPKNDIIKLPVNATVLDFAFQIHDDVGYQALMGIVNGKQQKLDYELTNGDKVEIKLAKSKKTLDKMLIQKVKTSKAKSNIRNINL